MKLLIIFTAVQLLHYANSWTVNCDLKGACYVEIKFSNSMSSIITNYTNSSVYLTPGYIPIFPEKNIIPLKNVTTIPEDIWNVNQKTLGVSLQGKLKGSYNYECAGGLNECMGGCCKNGKCSDPVNVCVLYSNNIDIIYLAVGCAFFFFLIFYWTCLFVLGNIYNAKPRALKSDNIYVKFNPTRIVEQTPSNPDQEQDMQDRQVKEERELDNKKDIDDKNKQNQEINPNNENKYIQGVYSTSRSDNNLVSNEAITNSDMNRENQFKKNLHNMEAIPEESLKSSHEFDSRKRLGDSIFNRNKVRSSIKNNLSNLEHNLSNKQIKEETFEEKVLVGDSNTRTQENEVIKNIENIGNEYIGPHLDKVEMKIIKMNKDTENNEEKLKEPRNTKNNYEENKIEDKILLVKDDGGNKLPENNDKKDPNKSQNFFDWMFN